MRDRPLSGSDAIRKALKEATPATDILAEAVRVATLKLDSSGPGLFPGTSADNAALPSPVPVRPADGAKIASVAEIGELIRAARRRQRLSQQRFADLAGVGRRFVSELEAGKPTLEVGRVLQCCATAGIDLFARSRAAS